MAAKRLGNGRPLAAASGELRVLIERLPPGVSVWTNGQVLWWRAREDETTWPAADAAGAAQRVQKYAGG
jgi:hypothetical protein